MSYLGTHSYLVGIEMLFSCFQLFLNGKVGDLSQCAVSVFFLFRRIAVVRCFSSFLFPPPFAATIVLYCRVL